MNGLVVLDPGTRTTVQDLGRPGYAHLGIPASGAADRASLTLANRLVGNPEGAAALETTLRGPRLRALNGMTIALTGAVASLRVDGREAAMNAPVRVGAGAVIEIGGATMGVRSYLAVRGGIAGDDVLGSLASDQLTGLGPPPLTAQTMLAVGAAALDHPAVDIAPVAPPLQQLVVPIHLGPRAELLAPDALTLLHTAEFTVSPRSDRIGLRLGGPLLQHRTRQELRSEGLVEGSLQVPPSGQPILMLRDHPTTGGYPVAGVVASGSLDAVAQLAPGARLRFASRDAAAP